MKTTCVLILVLLCLMALLTANGQATDATELRSCSLEKWTLEERQNRSQIIFTGVIESCDSPASTNQRPDEPENDAGCQSNEPDLRLIVRVKKVFKGLQRLFEGRLVSVFGLKDPRLCPSRVRLRDTRIFLVDIVTSEKNQQTPTAEVDNSIIRLRLNSSLLAVSLRHLQQLRAFTKDAPNADTKTVPLEEADKPDPCALLKCPPGAKCVIQSSPTPDDADAKTATCQCPTKCSSYGDNVGSRPVCGVDGKDYPNLCELSKSSCHANRLIEVKFQGVCDPCAALECPSPSVCLLDSERKAHCRCETVCPSDFQPVCGSDGHSYSSQCHLMQEACRTQRHLRILYKGLCESGSHPCEKAGCEADEQCEVDESGMPQCVCPGPCPPIHRPVCGSNGRTYSSNCELARETCLSKIVSVSLMYEGACGSSPACSGYRCPVGGYCVENPPGYPSCHCPVCGGEWEPVCGSDGVTYTNPCRLRYEACRHNKSLSVVYKGMCNGCDQKRCDFYASCEMDEMGRPECVCPKNCSRLAASEVCGTDGNTYRNECELKSAACIKQQFIVVASPGDCDLCKRVHCDNGARCDDGVCVCPTHCPTVMDAESSICSTDGRTYSSECHMQRAACDHALSLQVLHRGPCPTPPADLILAGSDYHDGSYSAPSLNNILPARKCLCNKQGSVDGTCDPVSMQCRCLPGVGGRTCDRCLSGSWGLHTVGSTLTKGCEPCDCHHLGSVRPDCEQMTGRCVCRPNVVGLKCDRCQDGQLVDKVPGGCKGPGFDRKRGSGSGRGGDADGGNESHMLENESRHCSDLTCRYGAICQDLQGQAVCVCPMDCPVASSAEQTVCGSDGVSYGSECDLRLAMCRKQVPLALAYEGPCSDDIIHQIQTPARFSSADYEEQLLLQQKQPDPAVSKATRHVQELESTTTEDVAQLDWGRRDIVSLSQVGTHQSKESFDRQYYDLSAKPAWRPTADRRGVNLGESCVEDEQCSRMVDNSKCLFFVCNCEFGFSEDPERRNCYRADDIPGTSSVSMSSCSSSPCLFGGTCNPLGVESFVCTCPPERTGSLCERALSQSDEEIDPAETPAFHGQSFVELKKMKAHDKFSMEIEFKTLLTDGILLYAQQRKDYDPDYISLAIIAGHVELRFNLGNGVALLRSLQPVRLGQWHRVIAQRYRQDGWLRLDDDEDVATTTPGEHSSLDLDTNTFLGAVPSHLAIARTYDQIGTASGFVGCMRRVKIGRRSVAFQVRPEGRKVSRRGRHFEEGSKKNTGSKRRGNLISTGKKTPVPAVATSIGVSTVVKMNGITQCGENPCWKTPCANEGTCIWKMGDNYTCICKPGFTGPTCEDLFDSCASNPCADGSTCISASNRFTCKCSLGKKGILCDQHDGSKHEVLVPEFSIQSSITGSGSFVAISRTFQVGQNLDLEVWFLSRSSDGVLAYSARDENGRGDFIWLALISGRIQFRWDLGSGAGIVTAPERVTLYTWHRVLVNRRGKEATIRLDEGSVAQGRSLGPLSELNLDIPIFIGGLRTGLILPRDVPKLANLQGAVQRVIVNGEVFDKLMEVDASLEQQNVGVYRGPPCGHMPATHLSSSHGRTSYLLASSAAVGREGSPCQNNGICQPLLASFVCKCLPGFTGKRCEKRTDETNIMRPINFDGKMFLKYPNQLKDVESSDYPWTSFNHTLDNSLFYHSINTSNASKTNLYASIDFTYDDDDNVTQSGKSQRANRFEIRFRTEAENGLILWLSRGHSLQADYFALAIVHSKLELSFNLGKQSSFLSARSTINVSDGRWHTVVVERKKRLGSIHVDGEKPVRVTADPGATILNSNGKLWIGGSSILPPGLPSPYYEAFVGCMETVKVDRHYLDWHRHGDNAILHYCDGT